MQGLREPLGGSADESIAGAIEMNPLMKKLPRVTVNYTTPQIVNLEVTIGESSRNSVDSIDSTVQFKTLLMNNNSKQIDVNPMQLNNSYVAVNSVIDRKAAAQSASSTSAATTTCGATTTISSSTASGSAKFTGQVQVKVSVRLQSLISLLLFEEKKS